MAAAAFQVRVMRKMGAEAAVTAAMGAELSIGPAPMGAAPPIGEVPTFCATLFSNLACNSPISSPKLFRPGSWRCRAIPSRASARKGSSRAALSSACISGADNSPFRYFSITEAGKEWILLSLPFIFFIVGPIFYCRANFAATCPVASTSACCRSIQAFRFLRPFCIWLRTLFHSRPVMVSISL